MNGIPTALPATLSEAVFQRTVIDTARWFKWLVFHPLPAYQRGEFRTAMIGDPGWLDLALARDGELLIYELKTQQGRLTPGQKRWLAALGGHGRVYRPQDWPAILVELRDGPSVINYRGVSGV